MGNKVLWFLFIFSLLSCKGQDQKKEENLKSEQKIEERTSEVPEGRWEVHKELDENGNVIRYDSIYSWSSSGDYDELSKFNIDSLMRSHRSFVQKRFSAMRDNDFSYLFGQDSLFPRSFFEEDMFMNQFGKDFPELEAMKRRMERMEEEMMQEFFSKGHYQKDNKKPNG